MCISLFDFLGNVDIPSFIVHPKIRQPGEFSVQFILIISTSSSTIMKLSAIALVAIMAFSSTSALPTCEECVFAMGGFLHLVCPPFTLHVILFQLSIALKIAPTENILDLHLNFLFNHHKKRIFCKPADNLVTRLTGEVSLAEQIQVMADTICPQVTSTTFSSAVEGNGRC